MIRPATEADVLSIHAMIRELAEHQRALDHARATPEQLRDALFGAHPAAFALVAESAPEREPAGFALWFRSFSTWTGTHGIHLDDLYVRPAVRGTGLGRALLAELARICVAGGYQRFEWPVLTWNEPSIGFYRALGAEPMEELRTFRLSGGALRALAASATGTSYATTAPKGDSGAQPALPLSN